MSFTRGKVTGRVRGTLNDTGKALFLKLCRSTMMAHHTLLLFTDAAKRDIKTHVTTYYHYNPDTGETAYNGPTILSIILQKMRQNIQVNVFNNIGSMKDVTLASCNTNYIEWVSKMLMKRINIELNIPGSYDDDQFLMDVYAGAFLAKCKTFTNEIQSQKQRWLLSTLPNSGRINTTNLMIQLYSNLIGDGTWKKYLAETDQIVALTTLVHKIQGTLKSNTIALSTKAEEQTTAQLTKNNRRP